MSINRFGEVADEDVGKTRDNGDRAVIYVNNSECIRRDGATPITGSINMGGNTLYNVAEPVKQQDVATKDYVDYIKASTQDYVNYMVKNTIQEEVRKELTISPVVMVNSVYEGPLIRGEYQFSFGSEKSGRYKGFLIPHKGRIAQIKVRTPLNKNTIGVV